MDLSKPARLQIDPDQTPDDDKPPQSGHTFNIWYLQWAGGDPTTRDQNKLKFRLNVAQDSGYTRGRDGRSPICLFYARGCCYKGHECSYLHRPPRPEDNRMSTQDCFGRDKTADYKDDMRGVGLLARVNKTLYVGGLISNDDTHEQISSQFLEFGAIDKIKVLPAKRCAFVSFRLEPEAQFAKEAMDCQSLSGNDIINVKWANEDMNPDAQKLALQVMEAMALETVKRLLQTDEPQEPHPKRRKAPNNRGGSKNNKSKAKDVKIATVDKEKVSNESTQIELKVSFDQSLATQPVGIFNDSRILALKTAVNEFREKKQCSLRPLKPVSVSGILTLPNLLSGYTSDES